MPRCHEQGETQSKSSQFLPYPCFYCGITITSKSYLREHVNRCKSFQEQNVVNVLKNNANITPAEDQTSALNVYQGLLRALQKQPPRKLPCDLCNETFESESVLDLHKMLAHHGFGKV